MIVVVQPGDTLYGISRRYNVPVAQLAYDNQIPDPDILVPGQTLWVGSPAEEGRWSIQAGGYAYPFISPWVLNETLPNISGLFSFSYGFLPDGTLLPPEVDDRWMVSRALEQGVEAALVLTPMDRQGRFSNVLIGTLLESPQAQRTLLTQISRRMEELGFTELNIDFEYIRAEDKDAFTAFVALAAESLPWPVSVCLAPKTSRDQPGLLYEGKDYAALGQAAQRVLLMTYEWGYKYGPPQAVAPLNAVERVVQYAVSEIAPEKIRLGLANYGYDWPTPYVAGETVAQTLGLVQAVERAREARTNIIFDQPSQSPWFQYTRDGVRHVVWFEDLRSWQGKFDLVRRYGLAGVGIWTVMSLYRAGLILLGENFRREGILNVPEIQQN